MSVAVDGPKSAGATVPGTELEPAAELHRSWWWLAGVAAVFAIGLPPAWAATLLVASSSPLLASVTQGVWIFKAALLAHAVALPWLARSLASVPPAEPLLGGRSLAPGPGEEARGPTILILSVTLGLALALRLVDLGSGLWHDEIATLVEFARLTTGEIVATYSAQNQHVLYTLLVRGATALFGEGAWSLRLPAALLGVASIAAVYWFGRIVATRREALLAAMLLAVSYHHVWFSQNGRGYTGMLLLALVGTGFFVRLLAASGRAARMLVFGYAVSMALAVWIHLTAAFIVVAHAAIWLALAWTRRRTAGAATLVTLAALVLAGTLSLLLYALVLPQLAETLLVPKVEFAEPTPWRNPLWLVAETLRGASRGLPGGWVGLGAGIGIAAAGIASYARRSLAVSATLLLPVAVTAAVLVALEHNLWPRFFFFAAGFAALIAVRGVFALVEPASPRYGPRLATAALVAVAAASALTVPRAWGPKQDYEGALTRVAAERAPGDAVVASGLAAFAYERWLHADVTPVSSAAQLAAVEAGHTRTWLLYAFPTHLAALHPDVWQRIQAEYRPVAEFPGTIADGTVFLLRRP